MTTLYPTTSSQLPLLYRQQSSPPPKSFYSCTYIFTMPFAQINNKKLFYIDSHPENANTSLPTALFLHGLGSSSCFYASIIPTLKDTTRCIALDYPGSGLSELGDEELSIDSLARDTMYSSPSILLAYV